MATINPDCLRRERLARELCDRFRSLIEARGVPEALTVMVLAVHDLLEDIEPDPGANPVPAVDLFCSQLHELHDQKTGHDRRH